MTVKRKLTLSETAGMNSYPTKRRRRGVAAKRSENGRLRSHGRRRVSEPPLIFVAVNGADVYGQKYARAHLRNRKGYVYLTWSDGEKVKTFYLGKAPRKSLTPA